MPSFSPNNRHTVLEKLQNGLSPSFLEVLDESELHKGHAGYKGEGVESHLAVCVVSSCFANLNRVERHKLVFTLLEEGFIGRNVHACRLRTLTPEECAEKG